MQKYQGNIVVLLLTNCCWSSAERPAIPSLGNSLGRTSLANALNDNGGHFTAS